MSKLKCVVIVCLASITIVGCYNQSSTTVSPNSQNKTPVLPDDAAVHESVAHMATHDDAAKPTPQVDRAMSEERQPQDLSEWTATLRDSPEPIVLIELRAANYGRNIDDFRRKKSDFLKFHACQDGAITKADAEKVLLNPTYVHNFSQFGIRAELIRSIVFLADLKNKRPDGSGNLEYPWFVVEYDTPTGVATLTGIDMQGSVGGATNILGKPRESLVNLMDLRSLKRTRTGASVANLLRDLKNHKTVRATVLTAAGNKMEVVRLFRVIGVGGEDSIRVRLPDGSSGIAYVEGTSKTEESETFDLTGRVSGSFPFQDLSQLAITDRHAGGTPRRGVITARTGERIPFESLERISEIGGLFGVLKDGRMFDLCSHELQEITFHQ